MESKTKLSINSNNDINVDINLDLDNNFKFSSKKNNKNNICTFKALNNKNDINEIFNNKYKAFEALESLILNDNDKNKEIKRDIIKSKSINNDGNKRDRNKSTGKKLKTEIIPVPKLDFTKIYEKFTNKKLKIIEIMPDDEKNEKKMDIKILNHGDHQHKHHHKKKNKINKN